ncbi:hypothetical protein PT276_06535 [Orbaceae bacterium ESL0721]|nr:hypothetical protein [Orbaceae bacterium ESL0721]
MFIILQLIIWMMKVHTKFDLYITKLRFLLFNLQSKTRAYIVGRKHYDFGNDLF